MCQKRLNLSRASSTGDKDSSAVRLTGLIKRQILLTDVKVLRHYEAASEMQSNSAFTFGIIKDRKLESSKWANPNKNPPH